MSFAKGTYAFGNCDYCAMRWPLADLKSEVVNGKRTGTKACPDCWSADHPQNHLGRLKIWDPQALLDPRPEVGIEVSRSLFGWMPVGHELQYVSLSVGDVTILEA